MKRLRLWLLRQRAGMLEDQVLYGELLLRETRARLIDTHRRLRQAKIRIAELTPAADMLREMMRRTQRVRAGQQSSANVASSLSRR